jgi:hypothetical protein
MTSSEARKVDGCARANEARRCQAAVLVEAQADGNFFQLTCYQLDAMHSQRRGGGKPWISR